MVKIRAFLFSILISVAVSAAPSSEAEVMESARSSFGRNQFKNAIELYSSIPASSDFWLDALEERAWSNTRLGEYESALADLHSITSTVWSSQVGPETYLLSTFVSLKICAYKDVMKKINIFKKRMLPRVDALEALVEKPIPTEFWKMTNDLKKSSVTMASLGRNAEKYPRYFFRDQILLKEIQANNTVQAETRLRQLAKEDLKEIELNLKKMKIIDVEVIQKILLADKLQKSKLSDLRFSAVDRSKQIIFPVTDDEIWVDEVGHFQVKADQCSSIALAVASQKVRKLL